MRGFSISEICTLECIYCSSCYYSTSRDKKYYAYEKFYTRCCRYHTPTLCLISTLVVCANVNLLSGAVMMILICDPNNVTLQMSP